MARTVAQWHGAGGEHAEVAVHLETRRCADKGSAMAMVRVRRMTGSGLPATGNAGPEQHEVILPDDTRRRLCDTLTTLDAIAHPAPGVRNIPL